MMRNASVWSVLVASLAAQGTAAFAAGVADYRAGRYPAAFAAFEREFAAAGETAPAVLRWNLALAALRVQRSSDAEAAVTPWLQDGDPGRRADAEFVLAMASFQRAERAAMAAQLPDAEPMAWAMAVAAMERALAGFLRGAQTRGSWPEAERNAARARARLAELQRLRDAARPDTHKQEAPPPPPPPPNRPPEPVPDDAPPGLVEEPLRAAELAAVWARIEQKEREKRTQRRDRQLRATTAGERGW